MGLGEVAIWERKGVDPEMSISLVTGAFGYLAVTFRRLFRTQCACFDMPRTSYCIRKLWLPPLSNCHPAMRNVSLPVENGVQVGDESSTYLPATLDPFRLGTRVAFEPCTNLFRSACAKPGAF